MQRGMPVFGRSVERCMAGGDLQHRMHIARGHADFIADFLHGCGALVPLLELSLRLLYFVNRSYPVDRNAHDAGLVGESLQDRLANPPYRVGDETEIFLLVEFSRGAHQTDVTDIDKVVKRQSLIYIGKRDADDEAQICENQGFEGLRIAVADERSELGLFLLVRGAFLQFA